MAEKKGLLMALVGKPTGAPKAAAEEAQAEDMDGKHQAAQEAMDAMQAGDVAAFSDALASFVRLCNYSEE